MNMKLKKYGRKIPMMYFAKAEESDIGGGGDGAGEGVGDDEGGQAGESGGEVRNEWPDTWRENIAGGDEKELKQLGRYATPADVWKKARALEQRISSGEYKQVTPFPAEGSEQEQAEWRAANGVPEAPDKYDLTFEDGLVIGDEDKPIIDDFLATAHKANMSPDTVKTAIGWYYQNQEKMAEAQAEADEEVRVASEDVLRAEWGNEYRANVNRINGLLDTAPEGVKDKILGARLSDGTPFGSDPDTLKFLIDMALQINPATTLVPGAGDNINGAISDEIGNLESMMGNKSSEYWKGPKAEKLQARYRELVAARDRMQK